MSTRQGKRLMMVGVVICLSLIFVGMSFSQEAINPTRLVAGTGVVGSRHHTSAVVFAELVKKYTDLGMSIIPQTGQTAYLRLMKQGSVHLAFGDCPQMRLARLDQPPYTGNAPPLRTVLVYSSGLDMCQSFITGQDTKIFKPADLKGQKVVIGYTGVPSLQGTLRAQFANAGLTEADVRGVVVTSYGEGVSAVTEGRADVAISSLGGNAELRELEAARGIRILGLDTSPEALERARNAYPGILITTTEPTSFKISWIKSKPSEKFMATGYGFAIFALRDLSDIPVYKIAKAVFEHYKELWVAEPVQKPDYVPERMLTTSATVPYHPGSIRYFKEAGLWTDALEKRQKELIAENPNR